MKNVVIVGGGASGAILAIALLGILSESDQVVVINPHRDLGRGIAYAKNSFEFLLNVRSVAMSIFPENPRDFVDWLEKSGYVEPDLKFMPRELFGDYISDRLQRAVALSKADFMHICTTAEAVFESAEGLSVALADRTLLTKVTHLVVAIGNQPSRVPSELEPILESGKIVLDPFSTFETQLPTTGTLLILGSGLTCIDVLTKLQRAAWPGKIVVRSRSGLFPQFHSKPLPAIPSNLALDYRSGVKEFLRICRASGSDWRPYVDGLRPQTSNLWQAWSWHERSLFLNRFGTLWNVHRHRVPAEAWIPISEAIERGDIHVGKGKLREAALVDGRVVATFGSESITCDRVICCMTPNGLLNAQVPAIESLVENGFATHDALGLGLETDQNLGLTDKRVFGIGPIAKGCLLESTAIPEIRVQAQLIASKIAL